MEKNNNNNNNKLLNKLNIYNMENSKLNIFDVIGKLELLIEQMEDLKDDKLEDIVIEYKEITYSYILFQKNLFVYLSLYDNKYQNKQLLFDFKKKSKNCSNVMFSNGKKMIYYFLNYKKELNPITIYPGKLGYEIFKMEILCDIKNVICLLITIHNIIDVLIK